MDTRSAAIFVDALRCEISVLRIDVADHLPKPLVAAIAERKRAFAALFVVDHEAQRHTGVVGPATRGGLRPYPTKSRSIPSGGTIVLKPPYAERVLKPSRC